MTTRKRRLVEKPRVIVGIAVVLIALTAYFVIKAASTKDGWEWGGPAIELLGVALAVLALVVAFPGYRTWFEEQGASPEIRIAFLWAVNLGDLLASAERTLRRPAGPFYLRVVVINDGTRALEAGSVNIVGLKGSGLVPMPGASRPHVKSRFTNLDHRLVEGQEVEVEWTAANTDFTPDHHVFDVLMHPAHVGQWPIEVRVSGKVATGVGEEHRQALLIEVSNDG
jgi:hypothetical protein